MIIKPHIFVVLALLTACSAKVEHLNYNGKIDAGFLEKLTVVETNAIIKINSTGGHPSFGRLASDFIIQNEISVKVDKYCFSSCAEYILPSAEKVSFVDAPIIGFHQNPIIINAIKRKFNEDDKLPCEYGSEIDYIQNLHTQRLGRPNFWKTSLSKLEFQHAELFEKEDCVLTGFKLKNELWLPNSQQLTQDYGLKFSGKVCADNRETCSLRIDKLFQKGKRIVIGDYLYVSKGL